ncbi:acyltransferase [Streptomyces sp. NPDC049881]|uniref:acyltransferase family protein n=1 Tax=Streptomyces sp. NPDC049881 TaxID=3155778 RepID=UPI00343BBBE7
MSLPPPGTTRRLPSLAGVRGVTAILVFAVHGYGTIWAAGMSPETQERGTRLAVPLVALFFVLSGFVMVWSARNSDTARGFWRRRAAKVLPTHAIGWLLCLVLLVGSGATLLSTVPTLFLVQNWYPSVEMNHGTSAVAWSLSVEAFCYLLFPVLLPLLRRIPANRLWACAALVTAAIVAVPTLAGLLEGGEPLPGRDISVTQYWLVFLFPPVRLLEFVLGMLLALALLHGRRVPLGVGAACALFAASLLAGQFVPSLYSYASVSALPVGLLVLALAAADARGTASPFRSRAAVWMGDTSYAIYLTHLVVITVVASSYPPGRVRGLPEGIGLLLLAFALCVGLSRMLFLTVEEPLSRRLGRPTGSRDGRAPEPAGTARPRGGTERLATP